MHLQYYVLLKWIMQIFDSYFVVLPSSDIFGSVALDVLVPGCLFVLLSKL